MADRLALGVLISGRGSNLRALIEACAAPGYPARVALVVSNRADAGGLAHARTAGIATRVIAHRAFADRAAFDDALDAALREAGVGLVCLAGFMRVLGPDFVGRWHDRLINVHPSLLPAYRGLDTHARALADGVRFAGCTVHVVRPELDAGPILAQAVVPVALDDTPGSLAARVLAQEHRLYAATVRMIATGAVRIEGERAVYRDVMTPAACLASPLAGPDDAA